MDEKGFFIGVPGRSKRIFSKDMYDRGGRKGVIQDGNRFAWLEQVFNRFTQKKARLRSRLLIFDGHGSHVTMEFLRYLPIQRSRLMWLQLHLQRSQGQAAVKKGDFWSLFKPAWEASFTKEHILKAFEATGVNPLNPDTQSWQQTNQIKSSPANGPTVVLEKFRTSTLEPTGAMSPLSDVNRTSIRHLVDAPIDPQAPGAEVIKSMILHLHASKELLRHENEGLRESAKPHSKRHKHNGPLDLQQRKEYEAEAMYYSPRKIREAEFRYMLRESAKLLRAKEAEERKVERERLKKVREKQKAEKAAEREAQKRDRDAKKIAATTPET
ncbi:hypothetical protein EJ07DRAFT_158511 [Lizonia empirigonia]|nr:hypothetical protein EJ07DRAFT_158511 [Lizonia empirigonia]